MSASIAAEVKAAMLADDSAPISGEPMAAKAAEESELAWVVVKTAKLTEVRAAN